MNYIINFVLHCIDVVLKGVIIYLRRDTMSSTTISIRVDTDLKNDADKLFNELGLNLSSAVNIFLRQAIREQAIPFNVSLNSEDRILKDAESFVDEHIFAFKELAK